MKLSLRSAAVATALAAAVALPAQATHIVEFHVDFAVDAGSDFPSPFRLNFTAQLDIDSTLEVHDTTSGLTIIGTHYPDPSNLAMTYYRDGAKGLVLFVGDKANGGADVTRQAGPGNNDLMLAITHMDSLPTVDTFVVQGAKGSYNSYLHVADFSPTVTITPAPVPEPSALVLMVAGLGVVGGAGALSRRRTG